MHRFGAFRVTAVANADTVLISRCQANDAAAFNEIVSRYKNKVYNFVRRMVGPCMDAEDLTQDVFVRAYVNIRSFQGRASLNTWLFRIATNICIDHVRKSSRPKAMTVSLYREMDDDEEESIRELPDVTFDPQVILMNKELGAMLEKAFAELPDKLRTVVLLHDVEGLPYEEIAQIIQRPLGTVKSRLFNARMALRQVLTPYLKAVD